MPPQETTGPAVPKLFYIKHLSRILLFYFIGLSVFFISGFAVFKVLFADTERTVVPDVVGRMFLGEHNKLRDDFKVEIKTAYLVQYPYGYILAQDLTPGKQVDKMTKLELLVNLSDAIVQVPKLVGFSEDLVDGSLASLPVGGRMFSLRKGVITRIPSNQPKLEVLAQFPPPGTPVVPNAPVSLLISDGPATTPARASLGIRIEKGTPAAIAMAAAYHLQKPAAIKLTQTQKADENAVLLSDAKVTADSLEIEVGQFIETLAKGKSKIDLEDLPFAQLFVPEKKWGEKGAVVTIARKESVASEDGSFYSEYFLVRNQSPLPIFRRRDETFDVYKDVYIPPVNKPSLEKAPDKATTKTAGGEAGDLQGKPLARTIVGEATKAEPIAKATLPEKSVRLKADTL